MNRFGVAGISWGRFGGVGAFRGVCGGLWGCCEVRGAFWGCWGRLRGVGGLSGVLWTFGSSRVRGREGVRSLGLSALK